MKVGRRLAIKLLNASKFALGVIGDGTARHRGRHRAARPSRCCTSSRRPCATCTTAFDDYDYARALEVAERFFWSFCDDYLELVKQRGVRRDRRRTPAPRGPRSTAALDTLQRLFAPALCYVAEEVWSWWRDGSVHATSWPSDVEGSLTADVGDVYRVAGEVLGAIRKAKSDAKQSMRAEVARVDRDGHGGANRGARRGACATCAQPGRAEALDTSGRRQRSAWSSSWPTNPLHDPRVRQGTVMNIGEALAWLDAHVNLETGVGVPTDAVGSREREGRTAEERADARPHPLAVRAAGIARARVPVDPPHRHERQDVGRRGWSPRCSRPPASRPGRTRARTSAGSTSGSSTGASRSDDTVLAEILSRVATVEEFVAERPSYFEILTAGAFDCFATEAVQVAVVEVGVGGTWDATSVVAAPVAVVTNVSVDHVEYLGPTRPEIAEREGRDRAAGGDPRPRRDRPRAGADLRGPRARADRPAGPRLPRASHSGSPTAVACSTSRHRPVATTSSSSRCTARTRPTTPAIVLTAAECFVGERLATDVVSEAFASVRSPGRLEVVGRQPLLLLDGAHNVAGAQALVRALEEEFAAGTAHARRRVAAREGAARDARGARCASAAGHAVGVHAAAEPARAGPDGGRERRRWTSV